MQKKQPEQTFSFLDRNYVEEFKEKNTMRQVLAAAMSTMQPDVVTDYYEMLDGLLVSMYFKNPPGRLLRTQWTMPVRTMPDFSDWQEYVRNDGVALEADNLLDIPNDKVGVLRTNTKISFPSDNSIIRVDKHNVGQRRMGQSRLIKDNFIFGLAEQK